MFAGVFCEKPTLAASRGGQAAMSGYEDAHPLYYEAVKNVVQEHPVIPTNCTGDFDILSLILVRDCKQRHAVMCPLHVSLKNFLPIPAKFRWRGNIVSSGPSTVEREYEAEEEGEAGAHGSAGPLLWKLWNADARVHRKHLTRTNVTIDEQVVKTLTESYDLICKVMTSNLEQLAAKTNLRMHLQTDGFRYIGVVTRTYSGKITVDVSRSCVRGGSGAVNAVQVSKAELGLEGSTGFKRHSVDFGIFGVDFMCFPLVKEYPRLILLGPISSFQRFPQDKEDVGRSNSLSTLKDTSEVLAELRTDGGTGSGLGRRPDGQLIPSERPDEATRAA
jgi:hypothetical protein